MTYEVWIHIDHIDNKNGKVWAVQIPAKKIYITCHEVECFVPLESRYRKGAQPRAYLVGRGKIREFKTKGKKKVLIYD